MVLWSSIVEEACMCKHRKGKRAGLASPLVVGVAVAHAVLVANVGHQPLQRVQAWQDTAYMWEKNVLEAYISARPVQIQ